MKVISRGSELEINGQVMKVEDVISTLKDLPSKEIVAFFNEQGMNMPRKVRMSALHKVLDRKVRKPEYQKTFTDEVRYRLRWIKTFSEHQLEGTLSLISNADIYNEYRETLWLMFIKLHEELKIDTEKLTQLYEAARGYKQAQKESIAEYQRGMDCLFYDERNEVDGLEYNTFREVLSKSSTLNELREIGAKYNIDVPRRIKKEELVAIIVDACSASGKFSPEEEEKVKRMSVQQLQRYAKQNGVKASIELKKEDIIEYIISRVETEVQKSYVNLAVLDIPTEDDEPEEEEEIIEDMPIEEEPVEVQDQSNAQIDELKAMILKLQQQMLNKDKSEEEKAELAKQAEEAQAKADAAEEALKAQQEAHEQEMSDLIDQAEAEKQQALADAEAARLAEEEAARLAEEERLAEEAARAEEEAKIAEEAALAQEAEDAKQAEMDALKEENETLKEQMANMQESKELEEDEFVVPLFDYEEETPAEETTEEETPVEEITEEGVEEVVEEPAVEEEATEEVVEEQAEDEEGLIRLEDTEGQELTMYEETPSDEEEDEDAIKIDDVEDMAMPDIDDVPSENYQAADQPTETKIEEAPKPEETSFDSPSYDDSDEYGSFDTPLFDTPIFEAPVFEAPIYGEDKAARERRLGNETRVDKKRKAAEEKAIKEALQADSKVARRKKKSNPFVTFLKWFLIIIIILLVLLIALLLLGILGVLEGTPIQDVYKAVIDFFHNILGDSLYNSIATTVKGWFGKN